MSEYEVTTLPILDCPEVRKIAEIRDRIQKGKDVLMDEKNEIEILVEDYQVQENKLLEETTQQIVEPRQSKNIESLYELTLLIDMEMKSVMQPNFTGKLRIDNVIRARTNQYYKVRIKQYARQLRIYITSLILVDGYSKESCVGYEKLEELVAKNDGMKSEEYLLKLLNIARQFIPPELHYQTSFVVDSNAVDPNKVNEG